MPRAPSSSASIATRHAASSRDDRTDSSRAICCSRTFVLSMSSTSTWSGFSGRYLFTPTIASSPRSTAAWRRAADSSMRSFGRPDATAFVIPPSPSTSSINVHALFARSLVRAST